MMQGSRQIREVKPELDGIGRKLVRAGQIDWSEDQIPVGNEQLGALERLI